MSKLQRDPDLNSPSKFRDSEIKMLCSWPAGVDFSPHEAEPEEPFYTKLDTPAIDKLYSGGSSALTATESLFAGNYYDADLSRNDKRKGKGRKR